MQPPDKRGWRATFCTTGLEHAAHQRDRHRVGAHAVARDAAGGVGGAEEGGDELAPSGPALHL